jgi:ectoine hydroxylase-related dioxygenase (phytanoyl-CoA dioxygenase family)
MIGEDFRRDGAVVLRAALDQRWIDDLAAGVEHNRRHPSRWAHSYSNGFWDDYVTWPDVPNYQRVVFESGLAETARNLMGSNSVRFFHEHVLVKEPGAADRTPWHHDEPYYCVDGAQNVSMWIALDPVAPRDGLRFIAGSHLWGRRFVPRKFIDHAPYAAGSADFELVPEFDDQLDQHEILSWDVEPGDVIAFHFRTMHDAPGNASTLRRRAVNRRWLGEDATFALRPWEHSPPYEQLDLVVGEALDDHRFPLVPTG